MPADTDPADRLADRHDPRLQLLAASLRRPCRAGSLAVALFFLGFGGWAAVTPLASAAIAPGIVSPDGSRRTVQHLEGGIIRERLVAEGSAVTAGQPLVVLADDQARATRDLYATQYRSAAAVLARLQAEQAAVEAVVFPAWLAEGGEGADLMAAQRTLFETRRRAHVERKAILALKIRQLEEQIEGWQAETASLGVQLTLIGEALVTVGQLLGQGYERRPRLLDLQREQARLEGERANRRAMIAGARQAIGETSLQIINQDTVRLDEIARDLSERHAELLAVKGRLSASEDVLYRTVVTAPIAGTVVQLHYHSVGGVVGPGQPILDIVPTGEELLVDARVAPLDIDVVAAGLPARIVLSAYGQRALPQIDGTVRTVSADQLTDPHSGERYFQALIRVDPKQLAALGPGVRLLPGMPAEVMILTGEHTALDYLIKPIRESLRRSFRED